MKRTARISLPGVLLSVLALSACGKPAEQRLEVQGLNLSLPRDWKVERSFAQPRTSSDGRLSADQVEVKRGLFFGDVVVFVRQHGRAADFRDPCHSAQSRALKARGMNLVTSAGQDNVTLGAFQGCVRVAEMTRQGHRLRSRVFAGSGLNRQILALSLSPAPSDSKWTDDIPRSQETFEQMLGTARRQEEQ